MGSVKLFKSLADKSRLEIINCLLVKPSYVELLAEQLDLSSATICFHLKKLEEIKLVSKKKDQFYSIYSINSSLLNKSLLDLIKKSEVSESKLTLRNKNYRSNVEKNFFRYGKLVKIPSQRKKRRIILEKIITDHFEKQTEYTEKEVSLKLSELNDDFCTLRRELVAEKLMSRAQSIYKVI